MALTDIARQLKQTFEGFGGYEQREELKRFKELYGDAECIQIGEMNYIVINDVYKSKEYADVPESISPLFFSSINNTYAIIDAETSSTLIDEVYSRVTYMQRVCKVDAAPDKQEILKALSDLIGKDGERVTDILIKFDEDTEKNKAKIFQCQLIMDTGVSASPAVYSFMLKNGEIKEIADNLMRQIKRSGEVNLLKDRALIEENKASIQEAVFDKYIKEDIDIQNIIVKSIFEISMPFVNIRLMFNDESARTGVYNTSYLAVENSEISALNANIQVCNECGHELIDLKDFNKINRLHINTDALDPDMSTAESLIYAVGCENCLVRCPDCGSWHFDYAKFVGSNMYDKFKLAPGREFIKEIRSIECNYCQCREGIEWIYNEKSGSESEHDVIPVEKMAFINYANEKIASYEEYKSFYEKKKGHKEMSGAEEQKFAKRVRAEFKKYLASKFDIDVKDIFISSADKCTVCGVCNGEYYRGNLAMDYDDEYRCNVCTELISEKRRMVTRVDGIVFLRHKVKKNTVISKYIVSRLGNLKKISSSIVNVAPAVTEAAEEGELIESTSVTDSKEIAEE